jgi:hypothetical protein
MASNKMAMPQRNRAEAVNNEFKDGIAPSCGVDVSFMARRKEVLLLQYNITHFLLTQALSQRLMQLNVTRDALLSLAIHQVTTSALLLPGYTEKQQGY